MDPEEGPRAKRSLRYHCLALNLVLIKVYQIDLFAHGNFRIFWVFFFFLKVDFNKVNVMSPPPPPPTKENKVGPCWVRFTHLILQASDFCHQSVDLAFAWLQRKRRVQNFKMRWTSRKAKKQASFLKTGTSLKFVYSPVQWYWFMDLYSSGVFNDVREPISLHQAVHRASSDSIR